MASSTTGHTQDVYIVSAQIDRERWEELNFSKLENIDPVLAFGRFNLRSQVKNNGEFLEVEPF